MEPVASTDEKPASSSRSNSATPFTGIRAPPSREDSDSETITWVGDSVSNKKIRRKGLSGETSSSDGSSDIDEEDEEEDEGFVSGEEGFSEEINGKPTVGGEINGSVGEPTLYSPPGRPQVPIAKVSVEEDEFESEEEDDESEVVGGGGSGGVRASFSSMVENIPKVRALSVEGVEAEEEDDSDTDVADKRYSGGVKYDELAKETIKVVESEDSPAESGILGYENGAVDESKGEVSSNPLGSMVEESQVTKSDGLKLTSEGDAVVEAININLGEALRTGAAVVGDVDGSKSSEAAGQVKSSAVEESVSNKPGVDVVDLKSLAEEFAPTVDAGAFPGELALDKDAGKVIGTGTAAVGGNEEQQIPNAREINSTVDESEEKVEDSTNPEMDAMGVKQDGITDGDAATRDVLAEAQIKDDVVVVASGGDKEEVKQVVEEVKYASVGHDEPNVVGIDKVDSHDFGEQIKALILGGAESKEDGKFQKETNDVDESMDVDSDELIFGSSAAARQFIQELQQASGADSQAGPGSSHDSSPGIDGQIITDSEEEADSDDEGDGKELFDSATLAALLKAAGDAGGDSGSVTITSPDGTRLFSIERPAGLGSSLRSIRPQARPNNSILFNSPSATAVSEENLSEEEKKKLEKMQLLRVTFLRLAQRLGHSAEDSVASQVLYRLALLAGRPAFPSFTLEAAKQTSQKLEEEGKEELSFSLNILVLGKLGVGKSATVNSIFGEEKVKIDAFEPGTTSVNEICGLVNGVTMRVLDTPGLRTSSLEQGFNRNVLASVKKFTKKNPPDVVLYVDRLDAQTRDLNDLPLLRTITSSLGSSIWKNAIVTLTHGSCAPPEGPSGSPLSYEVYVAQRSHIIQQYIGQSMGNLRLMNSNLMNPVSLVENHPACRKNREGERVLPNGQTWRPQLLLLCFSLKILSEATSLSKSQESLDPRKLFGFRSRAPPLPYLLSSLLQPRTHPKLSADQGGEDGDSDIDLDDLSDSEQGDEDEYDQLPPFKPLRIAQLNKLSKEQKKAYFEEYDYRLKLLQKKQLKEELRRMREMKKGGKVEPDQDGRMGEDLDPENGDPAPLPVPLPDMTLPPTFDGDNPVYRYRFLEPSSQLLARPVLDTHGWDHDCGYDGVNLEQSLGIAGRFPANMTVQLTKDKKEFNLHMDSSIAAKLGENGSTMAGFDIQNIGKQLAYIVRGDAKYKILKKHKTTAGISATFLGENVATGVKVEDQLAVGKRLVLVGSAGTVRSQKDAAYGANLEVRLREADYPIGQDQSSFVLSLMKWRGDLAVGSNLQSQVSIGRNSKMAVRVALNNKMSGQITVKTSSSDHLQLALLGLVPLAQYVYKFVWPGVSENEDSSLYF